MVKSLGKLALVVLCLLVLCPAALAEDEPVILVVTASRILQDIKDAPVSIALITRDEIQAMGAMDLGHVLSRLEGVTAADYGPLGSQMHVKLRGSEPEQVLVLIDGKPINSPRSGKVDLSQLPLAMVERIEVIKGPASALYGADALGGVVNIITKADGSQGGELRLTVGQYDTVSLGFDYRGRSGPLGYALGSNLSTSQGYRPNSDYEGRSFWTQLDYGLSPRDYLTVNLTRHESEHGTPGSTSYESLTNRQAYDEVRLAVDYDRTISTSSNLNLGLSVISHELKYEGSLHQGDDYRLDLQLNQQQGRHLLAFGGAVGRGRLDSNVMGEKDRDYWRVFIQDSCQLSPAIGLALSSSYDNYSTHGDNLSARAGLVYHLDRDTELFASCGTAFRAPTFQDLYWPEDPWTRGNPLLSPETGWAYEGGLRRSLPKGIALSGSVFRRDVTNLIKWAPQTKDTGGTIWEPTNIAAAVVKGLEARLEGKLGQSLTWSMAYTYLDGQDKDTKEPLPNQVRHRGNVSLAYQTPWGLSASLLASIAGEQEEPALPAYQVLDLVLTQQVNEELQVQLKVQNLLDEEYQVIAGYPAPPRTVTLGARHAF
ncbi:MAG: TonB-dependent receptor plug domain-containing protein [Limnochordia bacterium]